MGSSVTSNLSSQCCHTLQHKPREISPVRPQDMKVFKPQFLRKSSKAKLKWCNYTVLDLKPKDANSDINLPPPRWNFTYMIIFMYPGCDLVSHFLPTESNLILPHTQFSLLFFFLPFPLLLPPPQLYVSLHPCSSLNYEVTKGSIF